MTKVYTKTYSKRNTQMNYLLPHSSSYMTIRQTLRKLMEDRGENPHSLAAKSGVTQPTIFRILSGDSKDPRRSNIEKLARFFGVPVEQMYGKESKGVRQHDPVPYLVKTQEMLTKDEKTLLDGFRVADEKDRQQILWLARRAAELFSKRSGQQ